MPEPSPGPRRAESAAAADGGMDERLRRLETLIGQLQNTEVMEKVVAQKVLERIGSAPEGLTSGPPASTVGQFAAGAAVRALMPAGFAGPSGLWSRVPILLELRLMVKMYLDPRYRISRIGQFAVPGIVALIVLNYLLFNFWALPLISWIIFPFVERLFLIVLGVALYKVLAREAGRYGAVLEYLRQYGR